MNELEQTVTWLYETFANQSRPGTIDACPCCHDQREFENLDTLELRDLTPEDLGPFASSAMLTAGTAEDYLFFLVCS